MKARSLLLLLILPTFLLTGCVRLVSAGDESGSTQSIETYPYISPTPLPECDPHSKVAIQVHPINAYRAVLTMSGLNPGEYVHLVFEPIPIPDNGTILIEADPANPADQFGTLQWDERQLDPNQQPNTWQVRVIHQNGVACAEFTLPSK